MLDEAWRHLSDPARRKAYDALHQQHASGSGTVEEADFFLPPPPGAIPSPTAKTEPGPLIDMDGAALIRHDLVMSVHDLGAGELLGALDVLEA